MTKEAVSSSRAENNEAASLLGKVTSLEDKFNDKLSTVKHVNSACDDANGRIDAMLNSESELTVAASTKRTGIIDIDQLTRDLRNETDEINRLFDQFDVDDFVANSTNQFRALAAKNRKKLDDFDIESDQLLEAKSDEIAMKYRINKQLKHDIVGVVKELTDLRDQCSVLETKVMNDKNETSHINDDIDDVISNIELLNDDIAAKQAVYDDLIAKKGQSERDTVATKVSTTFHVLGRINDGLIRGGTTINTGRSIHQK